MMRAPGISVSLPCARIRTARRHPLTHDHLECRKRTSRRPRRAPPGPQGPPRGHFGLFAQVALAAARLRNQALFERVFDGVNAGLRAHLVLVTGTAANTDSAYLHVVCCHDRQSTRERNDSGNQRQPGHGAPL